MIRQPGPRQLVRVTTLAPTAPARKEDLRWLDMVTADLQPPTDRWVTPDDFLSVGIQNRLAGVTVQVTARIWIPDGNNAMISANISPPTDSILRFTAIPLYYGYLIGATVAAVGSTLPFRGSTLASLQIARPPLTTFFAQVGMGMDYLTPSNVVQWPYSRIITGIEGPGALLNILGTAPAAGAEWSITVPSNQQWRIRGIIATLTTSAAAGNRGPTIFTADPTNTFFQIDAPITVPPSTAGICQWVPGYPNTPVTAVTRTAFIPLDFLAPPLMRIASATAGLAAGDQWGAPRFLVEEWIEG